MASISSSCWRVIESWSSNALPLAWSSATSARCKHAVIIVSHLVFPTSESPLYQAYSVHSNSVYSHHESICTCFSLADRAAWYCCSLREASLRDSFTPILYFEFVTATNRLRIWRNCSHAHNHKQNQDMMVLHYSTIYNASG